ncbi:hypothetical protein FHS96_005616 [Sphingomonas zeicaulis]|uniref:hypothetical protein n=1 Tax=Sphingomonas zeicaulis TaxID=1632740 RepID=UPI003D1BF299
MDAQGNLFSLPSETPHFAEPNLQISEPAEVAATQALPSPLAAPCGFRNRKNLPCRRLACRPMLLDGQQMHSAGRPLLLCEAECFNGLAEAGMEPRVITIEDPEWTAHD